MWIEWLEQQRFGNFYSSWCEQAAAERNQQRLPDLHHIGEEILVRGCFQSLQVIPLRMLIADMQKRKEKGQLQGETPEEKYEFYNRTVLKSRKEVKELTVCFPELARLMNLRLDQTLAYLNEISMALERDKKRISQVLCGGKVFGGIADLELGQSDPHNGGKTVARITLDNGECIFFKPRSLWKEAYYRELTAVFYEACGMKVRMLSWLPGEDYGWETEIKEEDCSCIQEIQEYYKRMGIHLFLNWILAGRDLHGENIRASGAYPFVLDAEAIPGFRSIETGKTAEALARQIAADSVLKTGLLPAPVWNGNACLGALHTAGKQKTELLVPCIQNDRTANMRIGYREAELLLDGSLPSLNGRKVGAENFAAEIQWGFQEAWKVWRKHRGKFLEWFQPLFEGSFRVVHRHTQAYSLLISVSLHPDYLTAGEKRRRILEKLKDWTNQEKTEQELLDYEINCLYDMDIPIFEGQGKKTSLFDGNGRKYRNFFSETSWLQFLRKIYTVNATDVRIQQGLIRVALDSLPGKKQTRLCFFGDEPKEYREKYAVDSRLIAILLENICKAICGKAIIRNHEITWLNVYRDTSWSCEPMDMDFYDGCGGLAVFFGKMAVMWPKKRKYREIYHRLCQKLFAFTDQCQQERAGNRKTGAFLGDGSVVLSYLLLYRITKAPQFLDYAERHSALLEENWDSDENDDLLSGNAGGICILLWLYEETGKAFYAALAEKMGERLWKRARKTLSLTGMSHGASGFLLAFSLLRQKTGEKRYVERIRRIQTWENQFYSEKLGNWLDLRGVEQEKAVQEKIQNTWCHGAPGILLSRLKMRELPEFADDSQTEEDIKKTVRAVMYSAYGGAMCLCHGLCGNWMILREYVRVYPESKEAANVLRRMGQEIIRRLWEKEGGRIIELENTGVMTGVSGIGFCLMMMQADVAMKCEKTKPY